MSKRIARLEQRLDVQLLQRSTRKLTLTDEGLRFYEHCKALLDAAKAAVDSVASASDKAKGVVRVNAPVTLSQMVLAGAIARFLDAEPEVEVHLFAEDRFINVFEGACDVAIRMGRLADATYVAKKLATDRLVVCGAPSYLNRAGRPATPADLVHHQCLHYALIETSAEWRFRGEVVPVRSRLTADNGTILKEAAVAGAGLCTIPRFMAAPDIEAGRLEPVLEGFRRAEIGIYAVLPNTKRLPKRTRAFLDFLVHDFAKNFHS